MKRLVFILLAFWYIPQGAAQFLESKTGLKQQQGFFNFHYDGKEDKIYVEVKDLDKEFLYVHSLRTGLGSNDIGLDRGQLGGSALVYFKKAGNKLLLVQPNQRYRALTENQLERRSIEEAFAHSVLYGFPIKEEKEGTYIIDLTPFLMQDTHGVTRRLKQLKEGNYKLDASRSAIATDRTKAFPKNSEFGVLLTFKGEPTGRHLRSVAPDPYSISVVQHHSFVELPDNAYRPRQFDPRAGNISTTYLDYATPVQEPIVKRFANRHRLVKKNPLAAKSEVVEPIIYYLDPGTPEPVRSALLDGARWWNQAFEAAGFIDAFQVKILPPDADPMDLRYNVIQWVHRSTRGWSYGASVTDPRTGEIIKGHVSLGSLRIRQDFLIAQALMNRPFAQGDSNYKPMLEMALARIRQLSAHEVGHTLGFAHNFAASPTGRSSVMDYPHPTLTLNNGAIDFSNAYATGIGEWDKVTVKYSYGIPPGELDERTYLNNVLEAAETSGLQYITDSDARPQGGAHYRAHLWDNGASATDELTNVLALRKQAIQNFSEDNIRTNEAYSVLEDVFVPLYFYHRYQAEASVKLIGGLDYNYAVKGDPHLSTVKALEVSAQKDALTRLLQAMSADELAIPKAKLGLFPPRAHGYFRSRESFKSKTGVAFDALGAVETASDMVLRLLFHPERANRLVQQKATDKGQLGLAEVFDQLMDETFDKRHSDVYLAEVQRTINYNVLKHLMNLSVNPKAIPQVKAFAKAELFQLKDRFETAKDDAVHARYMLSEIKTFLEDPKDFKLISAPQIPDGSPIGCFENPIYDN